MAQNIVINLVVDDKGTVKRVTQNAKAAKAHFRRCNVAALTGPGPGPNYNAQAQKKEN